MAVYGFIQLFVALTFLWTKVEGVSMTTKPSNEARYVNDLVELKCEFDDPEFELEWSDCRDGTCKLIFRDGKIVDPAAPPVHHSSVNKTTTPGTKSFSLLINGAQPSDGGQFRCADGVNKVQGLAEVIVLERDMDCFNNLADNEVEEGDFIQLTSEMGYHGRWPPRAKFYDQNGTSVTEDIADESSSDRARYSVMLEATRSLRGQILSAAWSFDDVTGTEANEATNTPDFPQPNTCSFTAVEVFWPPVVTIEPEQMTYGVGDVINCTADSNPTSDVRWIKDNSSVFFICAQANTCPLEVTADMVDVNSTYVCEACNLYMDQKRCATENITFTANEMTTILPATIFTTKRSTTTTRATTTTRPDSESGANAFQPVSMASTIFLYVAVIALRDL